MIALLVCIPGDVPRVYAPMYHRNDREDLVAALPAFNKLGLKPSDHPNSPVMLSSRNSGDAEDSEETEDDDLVAA